MQRQIIGSTCSNAERVQWGYSGGTVGVLMGYSRGTMRVQWGNTRGTVGVQWGYKMVQEKSIKRHNTGILFSYLL